MEGVGVDEESAETGVVAVCAVDAEVEGLGEITPPLPGDDDDAVGLLWRPWGCKSTTDNESTSNGIG